MREILWTIESFPQDWRNILDVLLVALILFVIFQLVRGTYAATLLRGIVILLVLVWLLSVLLNLRGFTWLLSHTLTALAIALPVIFQPELRRALNQLGRLNSFLGLDAAVIGAHDESIEAVCHAVGFLARRRHGALIVFERETGLQEYIDTGVRLSARVTSELLQTTFFPNTALHDGAVIVRGNQIAAGACVLPLSTSLRLPDQLMGLRHRAALGISEVSDAIAVVVSEQTGQISLAVDGRFIRGLDAQRLAMMLRQYFPAEPIPAVVLWLRRVLAVAEE
jgi:diadenylate cyclase